MQLRMQGGQHFRFLFGGAGLGEGGEAEEVGQLRGSYFFSRGCSGVRKEGTNRPAGF